MCPRGKQHKRGLPAEQDSPQRPCLPQKAKAAGLALLQPPAPERNARAPSGRPGRRAQRTGPEAPAGLSQCASASSPCVGRRSGGRHALAQPFPTPPTRGGEAPSRSRPAEEGQRLAESISRRQEKKAFFLSIDARTHAHRVKHLYLEIPPKSETGRLAVQCCARVFRNMQIPLHSVRSGCPVSAPEIAALNHSKGRREGTCLLCLCVTLLSTLCADGAVE